MQVGASKSFCQRLSRMTPAELARIASIIVNAIAIVGGGWLLLAVFAACYKFY